LPLIDLYIYGHYVVICGLILTINMHVWLSAWQPGCPAGFYLSIPSAGAKSNARCMECPKGKWCAGQLQPAITCPPNMDTIAAGSANILACGQYYISCIHLPLCLISFILYLFNTAISDYANNNYWPNDAVAKAIHIICVLSSLRLWQFAASVCLSDLPTVW